MIFNVSKMSKTAAIMATLVFISPVMSQWDDGDCPQESNDIKYYYCDKQWSATRKIQARGGDGTCHSHTWTGPHGPNDGGCMTDQFSGQQSEICVDPYNRRAHWVHTGGDRKKWCYTLAVKKGCATGFCDCYYAENPREC